MNYLVKARARLDLTRHWKYIARDNLEAADQMLVAAKVTFAFIADNPDLGSQRSFRKLVGIRSRSVALGRGLQELSRVLPKARAMPWSFCECCTA